MNTRTTPKTHLVPVIKGVSDPAKGLVFRTYHVRPEQLREALKKATTVADKIHISKIVNYSRLEKAIHTGDITHLRNMFPKESNIWPALVKRNTHDIETPRTAKQKLLQSIYAFTLSQNQVFANNIRTYAYKALKDNTITIEHDERPAKTTTKTRVTEQVSLKPGTLLEPDLIMPVVLPMVLNKKATPMPVHDTMPIDYGKVLRKNKIVTDVVDYTNVSKELSAFINFINPTHIKVQNILDVLKGKSEDRDSLIKNMILRPQVYKNNSTYWSGVISSFLSKHWKGAHTDMNPDSVLYSSLILKDIDSKRFNELNSSYKDKRLYAILKAKNPETVLESDDLTLKEKSLYIAALSTEETTKNKHAILNKAQDLYLDNDFDNALLIFSAYSNHLTSDVTYKLLNSAMPEVLSVKTIITNVFEESVNDAFSYLLLQSLSSALSKTHYVPYNDIHTFKELPFVPVLALKTLRHFVQFKRPELQRVLNTNISNMEGPMPVGIPAPRTTTSDKQLFIRMLPVMTLSRNEDAEYAVKGTVHPKDTLYGNAERVMIYNPLKTIRYAR